MRLDKFLKVSRLIKRRTSANSACDVGRVMVNGREAKPGKQLKVGDTVTIGFSNELSIRVLALTETVRKEDAASLYEVIAEE